MLTHISNIQHTKSGNFFLLAGPCAIEGQDMAFEIADHIQKVCHRLEIPFIFKGSYRKANRSRLDSFTGIGDKKALAKYHTYDNYANQLNSYLRSGTYISKFQGPNMEKVTKYKCIAMAYYPDGRPKREIGVWYPDVRAEWTKEMDDNERQAYGLKPQYVAKTRKSKK